jgi:dUTP pyrophosphatase
MMHVNFHKRSETAIVPSMATQDSIGYDLHSDQEVEIAPGTRSLVGSGLSIWFASPGPFKSYARIAPRSGLALRGIDVAAGVCDADYRGEYKVILVNNSKEVFRVKRGDRIAQLIFELVTPVQFVESSLAASEETGRAEGGFGSTGV